MAHKHGGTYKSGKGGHKKSTRKSSKKSGKRS